VYLHGTKAELAAGDLLVPGRESDFEAGRVVNHIYFTATLSMPPCGARSCRAEPPQKLEAMRAARDQSQRDGRAQIED
jgi:rifampin ADP-ribosylating transferase